MEVAVAVIAALARFPSRTPQGRAAHSLNQAAEFRLWIFRDNPFGEHEQALKAEAIAIHRRYVERARIERLKGSWRLP